MSISSTSNTLNVYPPVPLQGATTPQVSGGTDPDGDGDGARVHRGHGRGGQMQQAMMQALQSLGLSLPQPSGSNAAGTSTSDSDGDADGSTAATGHVKHDMRQFMHALFQAVKGENTGATASGDGTASTGDPKANFAAGLSALIAQAGNGSAPTELQDAFKQLSSDLQSSGASSGAGGSATSAPSATLQALLTQLQQNLGYGNSSLAATGNVISTQA